MPHKMNAHFLWKGQWWKRSVFNWTWSIYFTCPLCTFSTYLVNLGLEKIVVVKRFFTLIIRIQFFCCVCVYLIGLWKCCWLKFHLFRYIEALCESSQVFQGNWFLIYVALLIWKELSGKFFPWSVLVKFFRFEN